MPPSKPEPQYTVERKVRDEPIAGERGEMIHLIVRRNGRLTGSVKYQMLGKTLKIWNIVTAISPENRKILNEEFTRLKSNKDQRTLGEELIFLAIKHEKPLAVITPRQTDSFAKAAERMAEKYNFFINSRLPTSIPKPIIRKKFKHEMIRAIYPKRGKR